MSKASLKWLCWGWMILCGVLYNAAATTNIVLKLAPDIASPATDVSYDAATDIFDAFGYPSTYFDGSSYHNITGSNTFHLTFQVDSNGVPISSSINISNLVITGTTLSYTTPLLTGQFEYFTWTNTGSSADFRFVFQTTGGSMSNVYGFECAVVMGFQGTFDGSWAVNFNSDIGGCAPDTGVLIPEPSTQTLVLLSGCLLAVMGPRRRRRG